MNVSRLRRLSFNGHCWKWSKGRLKIRKKGSMGRVEGVTSRKERGTIMLEWHSRKESGTAVLDRIGWPCQFSRRFYELQARWANRVKFLFSDCAGFGFFFLWNF